MGVLSTGMVVALSLPSSQVRRAPIVICGGVSPSYSRIRVRDVLTFARLHLSRGLAADGNRVLSVEAVDSMQAEYILLPDRYSFGDSWGLGWNRREWDGHRLVLQR